MKPHGISNEIRWCDPSVTCGDSAPFRGASDTCRPCKGRWLGEAETEGFFDKPEQPPRASLAEQQNLTEETDMKSEFYTGYNAELKDRSRQLRKNMTRQERHLWYDFLRDYPIKIYRQRSIDWFIADFYCSRAHLVIEIDGGQHYMQDGMERDAERSAVLQNYGLTVVRVSNADIDQNFYGVCEFIDRQIKEELSKWED